MNNVNIEEIKNSLTIEQIFDLLYALNAEPVLKNNIIISRTICHGGDSHKLYYYDNTKLFRCYTQCENDTFDIFQLIIKLKENSNISFSLPQSINYVCDFFGIVLERNKNFNDEYELDDWKIFNRYEKNKEKIGKDKKMEFKNFDNNIINFLPNPRIIPWEEEKISKDVMEKHNIRYNPSSQSIVIPHYDENNNLIGIRERTLIKENEIFGKYRPMYLNGIMYNHPLGFSLYNLNNVKDNIKMLKKAIIFEGEKSTLKYASFFGVENDISVAVCGSNISTYQIDLLLKYGAEEIIIAFDKQFKEINDEEYNKWTKKLLSISKKYKNYCKISFLFDVDNLLKYKDSPIDEGPEIFLKLYENKLNEEGR